MGCDDEPCRPCDSLLKFAQEFEVHISVLISWDGESEDDRFSRGEPPRIPHWIFVSLLVTLLIIGHGGPLCWHPIFTTSRLKTKSGTWLWNQPGKVNGHGLRRGFGIMTGWHRLVVQDVIPARTGVVVRELTCQCRVCQNRKTECDRMDQCSSSRSHCPYICKMSVVCARGLKLHMVSRC